MPTGWAVHGQESTCITETHLQEWEYWAPYQVPMPGIWHWEQEPLENLALKASGACAQELHGTGGNRDLILERGTRFFMCPGSQGLHRNLGWISLQCLEDLLGKWGVSVACCGGRRWEEMFLEYFISVCSSRGGHFGKIWLDPSVLRRPRPKDHSGGITAPPISNQAASNLTRRQRPTHQRDKNQIYLPNRKTRASHPYHL